MLASVTLSGYRLCFHKEGLDGSGKCDLQISPQSTSFGAVYQVRHQDRPILDEIEGGYIATSAQLLIDGVRHEVFTYLADPENINETLHPFDWYLQLVCQGADYLGFPKSVKTNLSEIVNRQDENEQRALMQQGLLQQIDTYNQQQRPEDIASGHLIGKIKTPL